MGCGKSTVGRELARSLGCPFVDLDEYIVSREGRSIPEIFADGGEPAFRAIELQVLRSVLASYGNAPLADSGSASGSDLAETGNTASGCGPASGRGLTSACSLVLSLGGGTLTTPECRELVKAQCFNVYLRTLASTIRTRLGATSDAKSPLRAGRPLLKPDFEKLLEPRLPIYESAADLTVDTDSLSPAEIASFIAQDLP